MKKAIFIMILFALCLNFNQAHAQRYLPGMKGLQVTAGMADGFHWNGKLRLEERRVGKECLRLCRSSGSPERLK